MTLNGVVLAYEGRTARWKELSRGVVVSDRKHVDLWLEARGSRHHGLPRIRLLHSKHEHEYQMKGSVHAWKNELEHFNKNLPVMWKLSS